MKFRFHQLTETQRVEARERISGVFDRIARDTGKVWLYTSDEIAPRCRYKMARGHIWGIELPTDLTWFN